MFFVFPIGMWCGLISIPLRTNWYYVTATIGVSTLIFLANFPYFTKWMHTQPVYFENLYDIRGITAPGKMKYQRIFMHIMNIVLSAQICILFNYGLYEAKKTDITLLYIMQMIGSLWGFNASAQSTIGSTLLAILHFSKEKKTPVPRPRTKSNDGDTALTIYDMEEGKNAPPVEIELSSISPNGRSPPTATRATPWTPGATAPVRVVGGRW